MTSEDRRCAPRIDLSWKCRAASQEDATGGSIKNASETGFLFVSSIRLEIGSALLFNIFLGDGDPLRGHGVVARIEPASLGRWGHGVHITDFAEQDEKRYLEHLRVASGQFAEEDNLDRCAA